MKQHRLETKSEGFKIEIKAKVKGAKGEFEGWFCFDTGAYTVVLPKKVIEEIGAENVKKVDVSGFESEWKGDLYRATVQCGGVEVDKVEVLSSNGEYYLIGMNFIKRGNLGFFFDREDLILLEGES